MPIDSEEANAVRDLMWPGEQIMLTVKQRRVGPGGSVTAPTSVIATNKRLIILNRATLGIRRDYEVILYRQITSVRLERGMVSSSVFVRVQGYDTDKGLLKRGRQEGEIDGLNNNDAKALADFINQQLAEFNGLETTGEPVGEQGQKAVNGAYLYCGACGARNDADARFCTSCGSKLEGSQ